MLLAEPTYKPGWEIPGGMGDAGESPWQAAVREIREELGPPLEMRPVLLCVDWMNPSAARSGGFRLVFDGGELSEAQIA